MRKPLIALSACLALGLLAFVPARPSAEDVARAKELLGRLAGNWDYEFTMAGMPPMKGSEVIKAMPHGMAVVVTSTGDMGPMGKFEGHGLMGFDSRSGKWLQVWTDSMDPKFSVTEGRWSEDGSTFTVEDEVDFGMGSGPQPMVMATRINGPDSMTFTMKAKDAPADGPAFMTMQYTRKR
jgi:hypothetical protein